MQVPNMWWNVCGMNEMRTSKQCGRFIDAVSFFSASLRTWTLQPLCLIFLNQWLDRNLAFVMNIKPSFRSNPGVKRPHKTRKDTHITTIIMIVII